jgi:hypothetical protein
MADVDLELALALRREAEAKLCAARGEASFHQDRTVYLEERVRELEGQRGALAKRMRWEQDMCYPGDPKRGAPPPPLLPTGWYEWAGDDDG